MTNPYQSTADGSAEGTSRKRNFFGDHIATLAAIGLMLFVIGNFGYTTYRESVELKQKGISVHDRSVIDVLAIPGVICLYLVAMLTNSFIAAWSAFVAGMFVTYIGCGRLLDRLIQSGCRLLGLRSTCTDIGCLSQQDHSIGDSQ